jgi:acetyltransferase-like isoleucine patch superfamily enzyme/dTDP-4-dehydrorhamnose 3,5-epimerase-like enzyme
MSVKLEPSKAYAEKHKPSFFPHEKAIVEEGATLGSGTRIWAFAHILPGAVIGEDCNICDHTFVENQVTIGNRVTVKCGVYLWDGLELRDDVFIGPNVTFTNDKFPRSKKHLESYPNTLVDRGASIGANATILPGLRIGSNAMVGAGSVVTRDIPPNAIVRGNPARIIGYVDTPAHIPERRPIAESLELRVPGVSLRELKHVDDLRGDLCVAEWEKDIPFSPKRVFFVYSVPDVRVRGEHAHRECHQFLVCVHGSVAVVVDDSAVREEVLLNKPWLGLHIPPMIWGIQYKYSQDAVLMVFASHQYDSSDYIRDYDQFLEAARA